MAQRVKGSVLFWNMTKILWKVRSTHNLQLDFQGSKISEINKFLLRNFAIRPLKSAPVGCVRLVVFRFRFPPFRGRLRDRWFAPPSPNASLSCPSYRRRTPNRSSRPWTAVRCKSPCPWRAKSALRSSPSSRPRPDCCFLSRFATIQLGHCSDRRRSRSRWIAILKTMLKVGVEKIWRYCKGMHQQWHAYTLVNAI